MSPGLLEVRVLHSQIDSVAWEFTHLPGLSFPAGEQRGWALKFKAVMFPSKEHTPGNPSRQAIPF